MPRSPIEGMPQPLSATKALELWRREPLALDAWVAQQSVGAGQGMAKRRAPLVPADAADPDHLPRGQWPDRWPQALISVRHEADLRAPAAGAIGRTGETYRWLNLKNALT